MLRNGLQPWHLLVVALVAIVLMGSKKLPDTARSLGRSMRILKSETRAMKEDGGASEDQAAGASAGTGADAAVADDGAASCPVRPGAPHSNSVSDPAGGASTAPAPERSTGAV